MCKDLNYNVGCYYGSLVYMILVIILMIIVAIFIYYDKDRPETLVSISRNLIQVVSSIGFIPFLSVIFELSSLIFLEDIDDTNLNGKIGIFWLILNVGFAGFIMALTTCFTLFSTDLRHYSASHNIKSKSYSSLDTLQIWLYFGMGLISVFIDDSLILYRLVILTAFSVILTVLWTVCLPYHNPIQNSILACKSASLALCSISFILAILINEAAVSIYFSLIIQPIILFLLVRKVNQNYSSLSSSVFNCSNQYDFEMKFRHVLSDKNPDDRLEVLSLFSKLYENASFIKNDLFVIWEANFVLHNMKNESLARIKSIKISNLSASLEGRIQH